MLIVVERAEVAEEQAVGLGFFDEFQTLTKGLSRNLELRPNARISAASP